MPNPLRPYRSRLRRLLGQPDPDFLAGALESWEEAPGGVVHIRPALSLPGQVERIRSSVFATLADTVNALTLEGDVREGPTLGWRFRNVDLVDGVLYRDGAELHLRSRRNRLGLAFRPRQTASGALYESWNTNRWFGSWLMDALVAWPLAERTGEPLTTAPPPPVGGHAARYEELLGVDPMRMPAAVHFDDLIVFSDLANNPDKWRRQYELRLKLLAGRHPEPVPGVFLIRGTGGDLRLLKNERELAERLATERGFRILDPLSASVDELIEACGAARAIVGVEGSQLVHGMIVAPPDAAILPIQPPDRVAATLKQLSDRLGQRYGLLVAEGNDTVFTLDWRDLAATLDLFD
ncbi:glycosyltransferase 61 family protein [Paracoccus broussonetiae]|uniref:Glycosyltransferase 61 family protein n=1 Tax=Paracoccus broussonetiae subsp. drimophilus TaxID=3373869 RepID=A0ABW7LQW1_9RHOB